MSTFLLFKNILEIIETKIKWFKMIGQNVLIPCKFINYPS